MVGYEGHQGVGTVQQQAQPVRPVVQHLRRQHLAWLQAQRRQHQLQQRRFWHAAAQRGCGKGQPRAIAAQRDQAHAAFLHHLPRLLRLAAMGQPGVAAAQRGVAGKGQLTTRREDAQPVVGAQRPRLGTGRQHKGGLGQVGPARKALHLQVAQARAIQHYCQRIALVGRGGEYVHLLVGSDLAGWAVHERFQVVFKLRSGRLSSGVCQ